MKDSIAKYVRNKSWKRYQKIITDFLDQDSGRQEIIWAKHINQMLSHGEDYLPQYNFINIEALCYYNAFRNWPINKSTVSGELDDENLSILISRNYLETRGYIDSRGYWKFNWSEDRFIINGIVYKPSGDTNVAQAKDTSLVFLIILKRDREHLLDQEELAFKDINGDVFADKLGRTIIPRFN